MVEMFSESLFRQLWIGIAFTTNACFLDFVWIGFSGF